MAEPIVSRAVITRQAERAAEIALKDPATRPPNPYDQHLQPEHFRCWECDFKRYHHALAVPEGEASA